MVENKSPAAKGKFLLLSDLHHIQEGMWWWTFSALGHNINKKNIREAKI